MGLETAALYALIASSVAATGTSVRSARTQRKEVASGEERTEEARTKALSEEATLKEQSAQKKIKRRGAVTADSKKPRSTILTSPLGLGDGGAGTKKTLLGE